MPFLQEARSFIKNRRNDLYSMLPPHIFWEKETKQDYSFLMKSQWWEYEDLHRLQLKKLAVLMDFTYRFVPFYQKVFRTLGALPADITSFGALKSFPVIDKSFVIDHYDEFIPRYSFPNLMKVSSSGSSSQILSFYWHPDYLHMKSAANHRFENWAVKAWTGRIMKFGSPFYAPDESHLSYKRNHALNTWSVNTADLSDAGLDRITGLIDMIRPDTLSGYPSIINLVARHLLNNGHRLRKYPSAILTTSEIIHEDMRTNIETAFHARLYDWYGMIEGCASAGQCYFGNYHMNPEYNYMEFQEQEGITRIVGTNLVNLAFPLIRYDTGDLGSFTSYACPCGRGLPHMKPKGGRIKNLIRTGSGYKYFHPAYFNHTVRMNIKEFQIFQNSIDSIDLYLVPGKEFTERHLANIKTNLTRFFDNELSLNVHLVDKIERGPRGKYQSVICNI